MTKTRLFGTDGIRGRANTGHLTPESLIRLGRAIACYQGGAPPRVLLGHDGRRSSGMIRGSLAAGLLASGSDVVDAGLITTPGLSFLTRTQAFDLGVMVSASHNPAQDNGVKVFNASGLKVPDHEEDHIEEVLRASGWGSSSEIEKATSMPPSVGAFATAPSLVDFYVDYLVESFADLDLAGFKVAVDCANGGASRIAPRVFGTLGAEVVPVACAPDGDNINDGCGAVHPELVALRAQEEGCSLACALDGDGDRVIMVDERGLLVDGDRILLVLAQHFHQEDRLARDTVVATVMSNLGLRRALDKLGIRLEIVGVGDRLVVESMSEGGFDLGGEQSGHIVLTENYMCGDGVFTALSVIRAMRRAGASLSRLVEGFVQYPQILESLPATEKVPLESCPELQQAIRVARNRLGEEGRIVVRYSGTEPILRIMIEGPEKGLIEDLMARVLEAGRHEIR